MVCQVEISAVPSDESGTACDIIRMNLYRGGRPMLEKLREVFAFFDLTTMGIIVVIAICFYLLRRWYSSPE